MQKLEDKLCFFTAVDPMNEPVELTFSIDQPRLVL